MSEHHDEDVVAASRTLTINDLARMQEAVEVHGLSDLAADIWQSDEELDEFLADLRSSRHSSLG